MPDYAPSPKRLLVRRQQSVRAVLWALDVFRPRLKPTERAFTVHLSQGLVAARDALTRTERQLRRRERIRSRHASRRHEATRKLRSLMVAARGLVAQVFGPEKLAEVGFATRVEEASEGLLEQASAVLAQVLDPGFVAPVALLKGLRLDLRDLATDLEPAIAVLRSALEDREASRCDFNLALHDRNEALVAFNNEFLHVARIVEGLLRRAGLDDLADRVRPSTRRRGTTRVPFVEKEAPHTVVEPGGSASEAYAEPTSASREAEPLVHDSSSWRPPRDRAVLAPGLAEVAREEDPLVGTGGRLVGAGDPMAVGRKRVPGSSGRRRGS